MNKCSKNNRQNKRSASKKLVSPAGRFFAVLISAIAVLSLIIILGSANKTKAGEGGASEFYYKSIIIQPSDTLWSLAGEYITPEFADINEYISELKRVNGLTGDNIKAGNRLIVICS